MPELPEVETIARGMRPTVVGLRVDSARFSGMKMRGKPIKDFSANIVGQIISDVSRRGKYIILKFASNACVVIHLGMSGKLLVGKNIPTNKHDHGVFKLSDGNSIVFNDPRRFGIICYTEGDPMQLPVLERLGVEPLTKDFNAEFLAKALACSKAPIKSVIMNAAVVVGVGNIYACESLFDAGIHPMTQANLIPRNKITKLVIAIKDTLRRAILSGGSTLRDYVRSNGDVGGFQHEFKVYGCKDKPCLVCGTKIELLRIAGRSTYYCPHCQT